MLFYRNKKVIHLVTATTQPVKHSSTYYSQFVSTGCYKRGFYHAFSVPRASWDRDEEFVETLSLFELGNVCRSCAKNYFRRNSTDELQFAVRDLTAFGEKELYDVYENWKSQITGEKQCTDIS